MDNIGKKIRQRRKLLGLTLKQIAKETGLSISFLSQMERGIVQPSIASLKKIVQKLGTNAVELFQEREIGTNSNNIDKGSLLSISSNEPVVRAGKRKGFVLLGSNIIYEMLTPHMNSQFQVLCMVVNEQASSGDEPIVDPPGDKFGFLLKGELQMNIGGESYIIRAGDSVYHRAEVPHSWKTLGKFPTQVIWVFSPPMF